MQSFWIKSLQHKHMRVMPTHAMTGHARTTHAMGLAAF
jgi:hypothetical protein